MKILKRATSLAMVLSVSPANESELGANLTNMVMLPFAKSQYTTASAMNKLMLLRKSVRTS